MIQTDEKDFMRDPVTRALINTNVKALHEHRVKREQVLRLQRLEDDVHYIMKALVEIQEALKELGIGK